MDLLDTKTNDVRKKIHEVLGSDINDHTTDMVNDIVRELKDQDYRDAMGDEDDDDLSGIDFSDLGL